MVVYQLHGQTSQFKVWANGMQNPGLGKFLLESHLSLILSKSFLLTRKLPQSCETGIKDGFKEMKIQISVFNIPSREAGLWVLSV